MRAQVDRLGPLFSQQRIGNRPDDAGFGNRESIDDGRRFDWACPGAGVEHRPGKTPLAGGIQFVDVQALRLPVFVQAEGEIEIWLALQPAGMGLNLQRTQRLVIAIQINALRIFTRPAVETDGVEQRTEEPDGTVIEHAPLEQSEQCQGRSWFVAMNAGGEIDSWPRSTGAFREGELRQSGDFPEAFNSKLVGARSGFDLRGEREGIDNARVGGRSGDPLHD